MSPRRCLPVLVLAALAAAAQAGIDMREFKGPAPLHARSIVVDRRTVLVDSYNVDPRSENLNTAVMCVADDGKRSRLCAQHSCMRVCRLSRSAMRSRTT